MPSAPRRLMSWMVLLLLAGSASARDLIVNGSFEQGPKVPVPPGWLHLNPPSTALDGWIVTRDQIECVHTSHFPASEGRRSLDLNGTPGAGGVAQTFPTTPGRRFTVFFDLGENPFGGPRLKTLRVEVDGGAQGAEFTYDHGAHAGLEWEAHSWIFVATQDQTTLEFYSVTPVGDYGPALDNVRVHEGVCGDVVRHCTSLPNSNGTTAWIEFSGSAVVAGSDATLSAFDCTPDSIGIFIYGTEPASYPFGGGLLCIKPFPGLHQLRPAVRTDSSGSCSRKIDFSTLPAGAAILPGSAWSFQLLYRDAGDPAGTFNSTDAVHVVFC